MIRSAGASGTFGVDYIAVLSSPTASAEGSSVTVASAPRSAQDILTSMLARSVPPLPAYLSLKVMSMPALSAVSAADDPIASFAYDGDGNRVKSVINGVTTYFVGNYFELTGETLTITKYYYAGGQRIAMRTYPYGGSASPSYILSDHLGSTSITTTNLGTKVSETRYKPWGEVRYQSGVTPTDYTYTGQYSNVPDFGLLYYNARWYDPSLGRFAQADTIVPAGVQGYDRYAYGLNNPSRYTDPSGHAAWNENQGNNRNRCDLDCWRDQHQGDDDITYMPPILSPKDNPIIPGLPSGQDACKYFLSGAQDICGIDYSSLPSLIDNSATHNILGKLDAIGLRLDASLWGMLTGGDVNLDLVYFGSSNEVELFLTLNGQAGGGGGTNVTGGLLFGNNMPDKSSYPGFSHTVGGGDLPTPLGINLEGDYSASTPNIDGTIPNMTYVGVGPLSVELGGYTAAGYTWPIFETWNKYFRP